MSAGDTSQGPPINFITSAADFPYTAPSAIAPTVGERLIPIRQAINTGMRVIEGSPGAVSEIAEAVNLLYELGASVLKPVRGGLGVAPEFVESEEGLELAMRRASE